jgi:CheY-like chemotaxis protein/HPt (histidine-containing phosphotransfer) domain-containing protein
MVVHWGMRPVAVDRGAAGLEVLKLGAQTSTPFAIAIVDVMMPEMDGFEVAQRIQQDPNLEGTIVMMLSSADHGTYVARCQELEVELYIRKPVSQSTLYEVLIRAVQGAASLDSRSRVATAVVKDAATWRILLAEDNRVNQMVAAGILENRGHRVEIVEDGMGAVGKSAAARFDAVLMDLQMPEMDGLAATKAIRQREEKTGEHMPIIGLTAHTMKGDRERCLAAGMDGYLAKPVKQDSLFAALEKVIIGEPQAAGPGPGEEGDMRRESLDIDKVLDHVGGDNALLKNATMIFLQDYPGYLENVTEAIRRQDIEKLAKATHVLKGPLAIFDMVTALDIVLALEQLTDVSKAGRLVSALEKEIVRYKVMLEAYLQGYED